MLFDGSLQQPPLSTSHSVHCTVCTVRSIMYTVHYTLYSTECCMYPWAASSVSEPRPLIRGLATGQAADAMVNSNHCTAHSTVLYTVLYTLL